MITLVLVEDHHVVRHGFRVILEAQPDMRVVGETGDGLAAAGLVSQLKPDVLIVDLMLPGANGLTVTRQVREGAPNTRVVVLSMHADEAYVLEALRSGAQAYVLKSAESAEVIHAVREVMAGRRFLSPPLSERAIAAYVQRDIASAPDPFETLTPREREILRLVAEGASATDLAERLGISARTAETHRANIMRKLDLHSQTDLIRFALKRGLIALDP